MVKTLWLIFHAFVPLTLPFHLPNFQSFYFMYLNLPQKISIKYVKLEQNYQPISRGIDVIGVQLVYIDLT